MRAFLALPMPDDVAGALVALQGTIPAGRPVPEDNLHLTLAFLGDVGESVLEEIDLALSTTRLPAPHVAFTRLDTLDARDRGLVVAEVAPDPDLAALQAKTASVARGAGADLPRRRFRPHVTLTRANRPPSGPTRDRLAIVLGQTLALPAFRAETLCLYQSTLAPSGARHDILATYPLG